MPALRRIPSSGEAASGGRRRLPLPTPSPSRWRPRQAPHPAVRTWWLVRALWAELGGLKGPAGGKFEGRRSEAATWARRLRQQQIVDVPDRWEADRERRQGRGRGPAQGTQALTGAAAHALRGGIARDGSRRGTTVVK